MSDENEPTILDGALAYQGWGLKIFPVHAVTKEPMPGYGWPEMADGDYKHVIEDFTNAMQLWGTDNVSIAWALGLDGCMAIDVDVDGDHLPDWMPELVQAAVISITRRGQHLIFRMPPEMRVGNGTAGFPTQGWGEVRGYRGYIVIAGPDRPGLDLGEMDRLVIFPRIEYLREYGGGADAVSKDELLAFANTHNDASNVNMLNGVRAAIEAYSPDRNGDPTQGRHPFAVWAMCEVASESLAGYYAFRDGFKLVQDWWRSVTPPERHGREWIGICCWAVGRALAKSPPTDEADSDEPHDLLGDNSSPFIDWSTFLDADPEAHEWWIDGFWPANATMMIFSPYKQGKSTWVFYVAIEMATGFDLATGERRRDPLRVMYVNYEMDDDIVLGVLDDFGLIEQRLDLSNLLITHKHRTRDFISLDTASGAARFLEHVERSGAQVVIFDTWRRTSEGDENDVATMNNFVRHCTAPLGLKRVAYLIVEHTGHNDKSRARGSSAKGAEVDELWAFSRPLDSPTATMRHIGRRSWVPSELQVTLCDDGRRKFYERPALIDSMVIDAATTVIVTMLDRLGIEPTTSVREAREAVKAAGERPGRAEKFAAAVAYRKDRQRRGMVGERPQLRLVSEEAEQLLRDELGAVDNDDPEG